MKAGVVGHEGACPPLVPPPSLEAALPLLCVLSPLEALPLEVGGDEASRTRATFEGALLYVQHFRSLCRGCLGRQGITRHMQRAKNSVLTCRHLARGPLLPLSLWWEQSPG